MVHKVTIIGSGPAGLTAGVYLGRTKLKPLIIEGNEPGGQLMTTTIVENWPGDKSVNGPELMMRMKEHAKASGAEFLQDHVVSADLSKRPFTLTTEGKQTIETETIIIATGATHKKLEVPGEDEYWGKGVTTCATCDGPFYVDKDVVIAGGGNTAVTEASFLTRFTKKITIVQLTEALSATDPIKDGVLANKDMTFLYNSKIIEVKGDGDHTTEVVVENQETKEVKTLPANGVFIAIGFRPNTEVFKDQLDMNEMGYLTLSNGTKTNIDGVFAAGDVSDFKYLQAVTAAGYGCMAALDCDTYLRSRK